MWLYELIRDVADVVLRFTTKFNDLGMWFWDMGWDSPANLCFDIADFFQRQADRIFSVASEWLSVWSWITDIDDKVYDLYSYVHGWLKDKVYDALDKAAEAWQHAENAYEMAWSVAGVIGTTYSQIVSFIKEHAETIYETIYNYITNVYETIYNYITNVYETIYNYVTNVYETVENYITNVYETVYNYVTNVYETVVGVTEDIVNALIASAIAIFAAPFNLVNTWFDDIQDFFNDPADFFLKKIEKLGSGFAERLWNVVETVLEKVW